jgi:PAS domain S-box-containing protein
MRERHNREKINTRELLQTVVKTRLHSRAERYGFAIFIVIVAFVIQYAWYDFFITIPFFLFWTAVTFSAWFGGFGPGALTALLSTALVSYFFLSPAFTVALTPPYLIASLGFLLISLLISWTQELRQRSQQIVSRQQEWFRTTLSSIGDGVIATGTDGCITFMNEVAQKLTGWKLQEVLGQPVESVFRIFNETTGTPIESPVSEVLKSGVIIGLANHTVLQHRDGSRIAIGDSGSPIIDLHGKTIGAVLVFRDIRDQRRAQLEIEAARWNLENLFMEAPALVALFKGREGRVELFNPPFLRLWGGKDIVGKPMHEAFPDLEGQGWFELVEQVYDTGQPVSVVEMPAQFDQNNDGILEQGYFNFVCQVTRNAQGEIDGTAVYGVDVTHLVQARNAAQHADRLKLEFLGMVSHELRTPLTSIKGFATTLLQSDVEWEPKLQREFLTIIDDETDKLTELVGQLLDLSQLQAGVLRITTAPTSFARVITSTEVSLKAMTREHILKVQLPTDLPPLMIDTQRVGQVLVNLVSNAVKYSPKGSTILIDVCQEGAFVQVDVVDPGLGIPDATRDHVFEAFYQVERKSGGQVGAGLGLAICKGLIEAHGGRIWIQERNEPGTTISFTLPVVS